jgi:hypothetical protein
MHKVMKEIDVLITEIKNHLFVLVSNSLLEVEQYKRKITKYEPRHDKTNIVGLRPAWIQTSLRIRAV